MKKWKKFVIVAMCLLAVSIILYAECPPPPTIGENPLSEDVGKLYCGESYKVEFVPDDPDDPGVFDIMPSHDLPEGVSYDGLCVTIVPNDLGSVELVFRVTYTADVGSYTVAQEIKYNVIKVGGHFHLNFSKN